MLKRRQYNIMYNMELKMSKIDNMNPYDSFDYKSYEQSGENYWNKQPDVPKKKKVSFNDILSNMNLVVNKQGVLQYMIPAKEDAYEQPTDEYNYNSPSNYNSNIHSAFTQTSSKKQEPLNPAVKHSYIYNKYFKDYADQNANTPQARVPKTMAEYQQMLADDRKKAFEQKLRIEQIKSKKLLFTCSSGGTGNDPRNIRVSHNLKKMRFGM